MSEHSEAEQAEGRERLADLRAADPRETDGPTELPYRAVSAQGRMTEWAVPLWTAIDALVRHHGGNPSTRHMERIGYVCRIEQAVHSAMQIAIEERLAELEHDRLVRDVDARRFAAPGFRERFRAALDDDSNSISAKVLYRHARTRILAVFDRVAMSGKEGEPPDTGHQSAHGATVGSELGAAVDVPRQADEASEAQRETPASEPHGLPAGAPTAEHPAIRAVDQLGGWLIPDGRTAYGRVRAEVRALVDRVAALEAEIRKLTYDEADARSIAQTTRRLLAESEAGGSVLRKRVAELEAALTDQRKGGRNG